MYRQFSQSSLPYSQTQNLNVRESMKVLSDYLQPILTLVTGKPLSKQTPWQVTPTYHIFTALAILITGVIVSTFIVIYSKLTWMLVLSWIITVSGARKLQLMIMHQCAHGQFSGNQKIDEWVGKAISIVLCIEDFNSYREGHLENHHNGYKLSTSDDPTVSFLFNMISLQPGMTKKQLWTRLITAIFSPFFHARFLFNRLKSSFCSPSLRHNINSFLFASLIFVLVFLTNSWFIFFVAWIFPLTILYQISASLRLCAEHCFLEVEFSQQRRNKKIISRLTVGIFLGESIPDSSLPFFKRNFHWIIWWIRMIFIHLLCRVFVMVSDTPCHDYHHRHPTTKNWSNYIFARQKDLELGCPGYPEPYREVWGLFNAIDFTFESLSNLPSTYFSPDFSRDVEREEWSASLY